MVAEHDHDENWVKLQQRCLARRIKLNDDKAVLKQDNVAFMGHMITTERTRVDDGKLKAIMKVSAPTNVQFCGMIQYLAWFTPDLTSDLVHIRSLTWQNAEWNWSKKCTKTFNSAKKISSILILVYFDPDKEFVLQVDSSKGGLSAILVLGGKLVTRLLGL